MVWGSFHARLHCRTPMPAVCMSAWPQEGEGLTRFLSSCFFRLQSHKEFSFSCHHWVPNWIQKYSTGGFSNRRMWAVFRFIGLILLAFSSHLYPESFMLHLLLNCLKTQITRSGFQLVCEHNYFSSISSQTWNTLAESSRQGEEMDRNVLCPAVLHRWAAMEIRLPGKNYSGSPHRATACLQSRIRGNRQASKKAKVLPSESQ